MDCLKPEDSGSSTRVGDFSTGGSAGAPQVVAMETLLLHGSKLNQGKSIVTVPVGKEG